MLECNNLSFSYRDRVIFRDLSFRLSPGLTMLLGPNGSGKSTLLKLLAGFEKPQTGEVLLEGAALTQFSGRERAKKIAVVPQFMPPALDFTAEEFIRMGRQARHSLFLPSETDQDRTAVEWVVQLLELEPFRHTPCSRLSGGECQRVALAQALVQETPILLLDEPTASLDPAHAVKVLNILRHLPTAPQIMMISHDVLLAQNFSDRVVLLADGAILADGSPEEVLTVPLLEKVYGCSVQYFTGIVPEKIT